MVADVFKPALLVIDLQEDFCPPNGSLAVASGRAIVPVVNELLDLPFALKVATKDWHPPTHVSFAANHAGAQPFVSTTNVVHPNDHSRAYTTRLWPVHCVQGTAGAEIVQELNRTRLDAVLEKGTDPRVEMYSAFYDPFGGPETNIDLDIDANDGDNTTAEAKNATGAISDSGLALMLRTQGITHVFVAGLAADYCVRSTAVDAAREGFTTVIVAEGTRAVDPDSWETDGKEEVRAMGVGIVAMAGDEIRKVRQLLER